MAKQVRFSESGNSCQVYEAPDVPSKELYLTQFDYDRVKMNIRVQIHMMRQQPLSEESTTLCVRGLERRTPGGMHRCYRNRKRAWEAVFEEQERQQTEGEDDHEMLAEVYRGFVSMCVSNALEVAAQDAEAAQHQEEDVLAKKVDSSSELTVATVDTEGFDESSSSSSYDCLEPVPAPTGKKGKRRKGRGIRVFGRIFGRKIQGQQCTHNKLVRPKNDPLWTASEEGSSY